MGRIVRLIALASIVCNAILFVLLVGGSHASEVQHQIYPHKPVHLARDLDSLNGQPYLDEIHDAQQAWDDAVGGSDIILNQGPVENELPFDALVIEGSPDETIPVELRDHEGNVATFNVVTQGCDDEHDPVFCWNAATVSVQSKLATGIAHDMKIVVLNTHLYLFHMSGGNRWRANAHEFGHMLGLEGHESEGPAGSYHGMMDGFPDVFPQDYQIWNLPDVPSVPDEASCVRELFDVDGKQGCSD